MCDYTAVKFKGCVSGIVCAARVAVAGFVAALGDVGRAQARHGLDVSEKIIEHIAPMAQHVQNDSAAVFFPIVPRRALRRNHVAFENPVAKLTANGEYSAKEAKIAQGLQLQ